MRGPHPYPDRRVDDLGALREILTNLDAQHARARAENLSTVRAALAMTIGVVRDEIVRAEAAAPRPIVQLAGVLRRLGDRGV